MATHFRWSVTRFGRRRVAYITLITIVALGFVLLHPFISHHIAIPLLQLNGWTYDAEIVPENNFLVHDGKVSAFDIIALGRLRWVNRLTLTGEKCGDKDLERICSLPNIQQTTKYMSLHGTSVTSLVPLKRLNVEELVLWDCDKITEFNAVLHAKNLRSVSIWGETNIVNVEEVPGVQISLPPKTKPPGYKTWAELNRLANEKSR